ncbi:MAG: hypothetical protein HRT45_05315 [Bdellovibrionales bacterium]|nr:hypothetical protein [Bdellovibrionales bacterium]
MLSQRVVKFALMLDQHRSSKKETEYLALELKTSLELLVTTHKNLKNGNAELEIDAAFTDEIGEAYTALDPSLKRLQSSAECVLMNCETKDAALEKLFAESEPFLKNMNLIVKMSELHSSSQVVLLSRLEIGFYLAILLLMGYEIFFVMFPMNKMLADQLRDLAMHRQALYQKARMASIGELAGGVAHEVNNPLAIIKGYLIALQKHAKFLEDETFRHGLSKIESARERITGIIAGMKAFSRPEQGRPSQLNLAETVEESVKIIRGLFESEGQNFVFTVDESAKGAFITADKSKFQQALVNVLTNAKQANDDKNGRKISIQLEYADDVAQIRVRDEGPGVSSDISQRIFDPFFTTRAGQHAVGMGLAIVYSFVNEMGGTLNFSNKQPGAEFVMQLPASAVDAKKASSERTTSSPQDLAS